MITTYLDQRFSFNKLFLFSVDEMKWRIDAITQTKFCYNHDESEHKSQTWIRLGGGFSLFKITTQCFSFLCPYWPKTQCDGHSFTSPIIFNPHRTEWRGTNDTAKQTRGRFCGKNKLSTVHEGRQNRGEKETKLGGSREGCSWQVWMWDESGEEEEEKRNV